MLGIDSEDGAGRVANQDFRREYLTSMLARELLVYQAEPKCHTATIPRRIQIAGDWVLLLRRKANTR